MHELVNHKREDKFMFTSEFQSGLLERSNMIGPIYISIFRIMHKALLLSGPTGGKSNSRFSLPLQFSMGWTNFDLANGKECTLSKLLEIKDRKKLILNQSVALS